MEDTAIDLLREMVKSIGNDMWKYSKECPFCGHHYNHGHTDIINGREVKIADCVYEKAEEYLKRLDATIKRRNDG